MNNSINYYVCMAYLALGPISWFEGIPIGPIKRCLLFAIIIMNWKDITTKNIKTFFIFCFVIASFLLALYLSNRADTIYDYLSYQNIILGIIENYICFSIGYKFALNYNLDTKFFSPIVLFLSLICLLPICNYISGLPNWYAPSQFEIEASQAEVGRIFEKKQLYETGFSWSRNGWGNSLALYLPLCFLAFKNSMRKAYLCVFALFVSIFLCGTRNGIFAGVISLSACRFISDRIDQKSNIKFVLIFLILCVLLLFNLDSLMTAMRLNDGDASSGRMEQYALIPLMIQNMSFWGLGPEGTARYIYQYTGEVHELHNTFFNTLLEYGWILGLFVLWLTIKSLKISYKYLYSYSKEKVCMALVIMTGLFATLFEPRMVFGNLGGYCIWWFLFGYISVIYNSNGIKLHD